MDLDLISNILFAMVRCGTPLLLVALGELVCEKSGVLNLGQEGMMLFGAVIGFIVALSTGSLWLGVLLAMAAGMLLAALFALVALGCNANQVATGLALTIFGVGLSSSSAPPGWASHWPVSSPWPFPCWPISRCWGPCSSPRTCWCTSASPCSPPWPGCC